MNELQFTEGIRRALDESAGRLPYRITHRLETARAAAQATSLNTAAAPFASWVWRTG